MEQELTIYENGWYKQEKINVRYWRYEGNKRIPEDLAEKETQGKRGVYAISREDAKMLIEKFSHPLSNDIVDKYKVYAIDQRYSVKDHSVLLKIKQNFSEECEPLLIVEPQSGGVTIARGSGVYGNWSCRNFYTALILTCNRVKPKYRYKVQIFSAPEKETNYTSSGHTVEGEFEQLLNIYNSSATGRHAEAIYIAIIAEEQNLTVTKYWNTGRGNHHEQVCNINNLGTNCENIE